MRFELMTPEERFTLIENTLKYAAELHAQNAEDIQKLQELNKGVVVAIAKLAEGQRATEEKLHALIETVDRIIRERPQQS
jgi:ribosomal protein S11